MAAPAMRAPEHDQWMPATSQGVTFEYMPVPAAAAAALGDWCGDRQVEAPAGSADAALPQATPAPPAPPTGEFFEWHNNVYQKKKDPLINGTWSVSDIQKYVGELDPNLQVPPYDSERDVPYESVEDYILTLRTSCRVDDSRFAWPVEGLSFQ